MTMRGLLLLFLGASAAVACVSQLSLEDRGCPCAEGYACCMGECVPAEDWSDSACDQGGSGGEPSGNGGEPSGNGGEPSGNGGEAGGGEAGSGGAAGSGGEASNGGETGNGGAAGNGGEAGGGGAAGSGGGGPICPAGKGNVTAAFFDNPQAPVTPTCTTTVDGFAFDWGEDAPLPYGEKADDFAVFFSTFLTPSETDTYTFVLSSDDGSRLTIDDEVLIDSWHRPTSEGQFYGRGAEAALEADRTYFVQVEYRDVQGNALVDLRWKRPSTAVEPIPAELLSAAPTRASRCDPFYTHPDCIPFETPSCGDGGGLRVAYYRNRFVGDQFVEHANTDQHGFWFGFGFLFPEDMGDRFSVRWEGFIEPPTTEEYTFYVVSSTSVSFRVGDIEQGSNNEEGLMGEGTITLPLTQGQKQVVRLEVPEVVPASSPALQIRWKSASMPKGGILECQLSPPPELPPG